MSYGNEINKYHITDENDMP